MLQAQPSDQLRDSQAPALPLEHEATTRAWVWNSTTETPTQDESKANIVVASGHDNIHGDFDAVNITPKTTTPTPKTTVPTLVASGPNTAGNAYYFPSPPTANDSSAGRSPGQPFAFPSAGLDATRSVYCFPTPQTAEDPSASRLPGRSPALPVFPSTSPVNNANRPTQRPLLRSPLSFAQKRHLASEPSPPAPETKRQRVLPFVPAHLPQAKIIAQHCEEQEPRSLPATPAGTAVSLAGNSPTSNEKMAMVRLGVRQSKGPGLRINTQAAGLAATPAQRTEPTHGEKLYADFTTIHKALRGELDHLTRELRVRGDSLRAANERASEAELRARNAENMRYQANSANFQKLKELENKHRAEIQSRVRKCQTLETNLDHQRRRNETLEARCKNLNWMIEKLKGELGPERQRQVSAFLKEHTKSTQELGILFSGRY